MLDTVALTPALGAEVIGAEGILHRAVPYDPSSDRTLHRTTIAGDEAWS